jgi:hypothetical protein
MAAGQDASPEAYQRVEKLQTYMSKSLPVQDLVNLLAGFKRKGTASWWSCFDVITTEAVDREAGEQYRCVKLQCNHCKAVLSANNPSKTSSQHLKRDGTHYQCNKLVKARMHVSAMVDNSEAATQDSNTIVASSSQRFMGTFVCNAHQQASFNHRIAAFFIKSFTPFARIEHPDFVAALAHLGCKPPTRKDLADKYLPLLYEETLRLAIAELRVLKVGHSWACCFAVWVHAACGRLFCKPCVIVC